MSTTVYLVRHGAVVGAETRRFSSTAPDAFTAWMADVGRFQFPGGECLEQVASRSWSAFEDIVAAHEDQPVAIVAHGGSNRAILCRALGIPLARLLALGQDYAALSVLERMAGRWSLTLLNHREPIA